MKNHIKIMFRFIFATLLMLSFGFAAVAQDEEADDSKDLRPVKNMFESIWLIDNQTALVPIKGTFEFDILHRFGTVENGFKDFWGFYAPSNIRLGFHYVPVNRLMLGFGITKTGITWDFNAKYAILQQARKGGSPVALTYFVNAAVETKDKALFSFIPTEDVTTSDRFSYFHQLILARKITESFSIQAAGSMSHYNTVEAYETSSSEVEGRLKNDHIAVAFGARYKISPALNIIANWDQPITKHNDETVDPKSNISFGIEFVTSAHQIQLFAGNFNSIVPQRNNMFNQNSFGDGNVLIGFNMTRLWNF